MLQIFNQLKKPYTLICSLHTSQQILNPANKKLLATLRKNTGYPISQCRNALDRFQNDVKEAEKWLHEEASKQGWAKAEKLGGRSMSHGLVGVLHESYTSVMVEVNCETDFVARTPTFQNIVASVAHACLLDAPSNSERKQWSRVELETLSTESGSRVADVVALAVGEIRENIAVRRAIAMSAVTPDYLIGSYSHAPWQDASRRVGKVDMGRFAALARLQILETNSQLNEDNKFSLWARQFCQHVVGLNPTRLGDSNADVPNKNKEDENLLIFQEFLLEDTKTVGQWLTERGLKVNEFTRIECGEVLPEHDIIQKEVNVA